MSDKDAERVLVIPTQVLRDAGLFHGLSTDVGKYLPALLDARHFQFLERRVAEHDPEFKQLIPYAVLRHGDRVFHYRRGAKGSEKRLQALRSVGIGGHIALEDTHVGPDAYRVGFLRELAEEVELGAAYRERVVGLINDDRTPVGQVHLGVVHVLDLEAERAAARDPAIIEAGFAPLAELHRDMGNFETWSQFVLASDLLDALAEARG